MKSFHQAAMLLALLGHNFALAWGSSVAAVAHSHANTDVNPLQQVVTLLRDLDQQVKKNGEMELKAYTEFKEWCETSARDKEYDIKTAKASIEDLTANIGKAEADLSAGASKIEELASAVFTNEADLKAATGIRMKEETDFRAVEAELVEVIDTLERAIIILERKMSGSTMLQAKVDTQDVAKLVKALDAVLDAASLSLHDKQKLLALAQSHSAEEDDVMDLGAPEAEVYRSHSEGIIDVLQDLKDKAETQLNEVRKQEMSAKHNYQMLKQSLEDQIASDTKEMDETKTATATTSEEKATAEGDLEKTKKDLADAESALELSQNSCTTAAADHEASVKSRQEELAAIAEALKALTEMTAGAEAAAYAPASFLQLAGSSSGGGSSGHLGRVAFATGSRLATQTDLANFEVVNLVRQLAKKHHSAALSQLAGRIQAAIKYGTSTGQDPFAKVKALIKEMIERLQKEAGTEATHKAFCDKEMAETTAKTDYLTGTLGQLSAKIDQKKASSVALKNEVQELQAELAELAKTQVELNEARTAEHTAYAQRKADLEQGLRGVRMALKVLHEYYASGGVSASASFLQQRQRQPEVPTYHSQASGAGSSIIGLLEVVESDFGKDLAETENAEDTAASEYQKVTQQNKISKTMKDSDVKYKTKEAAALDKAVAELTSDRETSQTELDAVLEYSKGIRAQCVAAPETYEERKSRRDAEITGLREALQILEGEVLMQRQKIGLRRTSASKSS